MLDKNNFFNKYSIKETFEKSGLQWETLEAIYDDYVSLEKDLKRCCVGLEKILSDNFQNPFQSNGETANGFHSIQGRIKSPEHLIEKIIRKRGKEHSSKYKEINVSNYKSIVRDLIGIRILVLALT